MDSLLAGLLDLFFPRRCVACGQRGEWICCSCRPNLPTLPVARCRGCGAPIDGASRCSDCWSDPPTFDELICGFRFEGSIRVAIHQLKYRRGTHLAEPLAQAVLSVVSVPPADLLVPVPLHPRRRAWRGYNQAELLASAYGRCLNLPISITALERVRDTPVQTGLIAARRRTNLRGAFAGRIPEVQGRHVLLVDDVTTTTGTLRAAAGALKDAGASRVSALVVARAI